MSSSKSAVFDALSLICKKPIATIQESDPIINYNTLAVCLSELASVGKPSNEQVSGEVVRSLLAKHSLPNTKKTSRASLTYIVSRYLYSLPKTESEAKLVDEVPVAMLKLVGAAYDNFNVSDSTQERDMGIFRSILHKRYGESYAYELIKRSSLSNSERTVKHMKESKAIRNERHEEPLVISVSDVNDIIAQMVSVIWPESYDRPVCNDAIPLLFELCTGARTSEVTNFSMFKVVSSESGVSFIEQTGCLKQKEYSESITIVKPCLLGVDANALIHALELWRSVNEGVTAANRKLNLLLQTKYLSKYVETHRVTTHLLRTIYANMAYETIVKPNLWQLGVCTLNKFLNDSLGHHSLEMGLAYLHVVVIDDRYSKLMVKMSRLEEQLVSACHTLYSI